MSVIAELVNLANGSAAAGDNLAVKICRDAIGEVERLQAIVDKLPKTADGVPVVPGVTVYHLDWKGNVTEERTSWAPPYPKVFCCCYSTREAAVMKGE